MLKFQFCETFSIPFVSGYRYHIIVSLAPRTDFVGFGLGCRASHVSRPVGAVLEELRDSLGTLLDVVSRGGYPFKLLYLGLGESVVVANNFLGIPDIANVGLSNPSGQIGSY